MGRTRFDQGVPERSQVRSVLTAPELGAGLPRAAAISSQAAALAGIGSDRLRFVLRLAASLHGFGVPAHRLEPMLESVGLSVGLELTCFVEPTAIHASVVQGGVASHHFLRPVPAGEDLGKLCALDALATRVALGEVSVSDGLVELESILEQPSGASPAVQVLAFAAASASASCFFGGGVADVLAAGAIGAFVGWILRVLAKHDRAAPLQDGLCALIASLLANLVQLTGVPLDVDRALVASLIVLIPGLTLTLAVAELATRHLASGVGRLFQALVSFGGIAFGVILGNRMVLRLAELVGAEDALAVELVEPTPTPLIATITALIVAPLAFAVLLRARRADVLPILGVGILSFLSAKLGGAILGSELGAFVGGFAVAAVSNVLASRFDRPSSVTLVPGILLLVPGSLGFRSVQALMEQDVSQSLASLASVVTVAFSLVAGLLFANWVCSPKRGL
ncbi:MAG: threonine/serine exporter family protein [Planctomycetota bacterium]